jgi:hypothetical protein
MRRLLCGLLALALGLFVLPAFAADDKKADDAKKDPPDVKKDKDAPDVSKDKDAPDPKNDKDAPDPKKDKDAPNPKNDKDNPDLKKDKDAPDAKKDKDNPDAKKDKDTANSEKTLKAGQIVGKLLAVDETKKSLHVQVEIDYQEPNAGEFQALQQAEFNLAQARAKRDFQGMANAQNDIVIHTSKLYTPKQMMKEIDLTTTDEVKVRLTNPPPTYDAKGNVKKPTAAELKELKGPDTSLPGYQGDFASLHNEQIIRVTLVKKKDAPKPHPKGGKDFDPEAALADLPQVSMIEILGEPPPK